MPESYKVILWGPGHIGEVALRSVIRHPGLELAGVIVHSEAKDGRDAGDLCGLPPTGVTATRDIDAALSLDADAVAYFASGDFRPHEAADDIARCLRAGKNVVTTSLATFCHPASAEAPMLELLEDACAAGGASFFNSGIDPGWMNDVLPLTLSGMCERIDRITIQEIFDYSSIDQPEIMFDLMGFGQPADQPTLLSEPGSASYFWGPIVQLLADGLGIELDRIDDSMVRWPTPEGYDVASGRIEAGGVGAMHFRIVGHADGQERIVLEHITRMGMHAAPEWPMHPSPHGGYRLRLEGMPTLAVDVALEHDGHHIEASSCATAMRELNAVPAVVAAAPGVLSSLDLPLVVGRIAGGTWTGFVPASTRRNQESSA